MVIAHSSYFHPIECSYCLTLSIGSVRNAFRSNSKLLPPRARGVWGAVSRWDVAMLEPRVCLSDALPLSRLSPCAHRLVVTGRLLRSAPWPPRDPRQEEKERKARRMVLISGEKNAFPKLPDLGFIGHSGVLCLLSGQGSKGGNNWNRAPCGPGNGCGGLYKEEGGWCLSQ